jgi:hypothetical protein
MAIDGTTSIVVTYRQVHDTPLTDRLLAHLSGPRWLWIVAWALLPVMHHVVLMGLMRASGQPGHAGLSWALVTDWLPSHGVQSYMIIVSFWAVRKLAADVRALGPTISNLCPARENGAPSPFAGMGSLAGPLVLTIVVSALESAKTAVIWGVVPAFLILPYMGVWVLPMLTLIWVYIAFLLGLDQLGRRQMNLESFPEDLSLGLGPVGTAVFNAFLIFCAITVPFLFVSLRDWLDLTIGLTFFGAGVGAFYLSVWRLHRQMVEIKATHVFRTRAVYAEMYVPLRAQMTPATLETSAASLGAAEALVRRALAIQEWPFDERTMTRIVGISTGVVTAIIARFILSAVGL